MFAAASERNSFSISALGSSDADNVVAGEDFEGGRINTLLVNHDEVFVGAVAEALLKLHNLVDSIISELSF